MHRLCMYHSRVAITCHDCHIAEPAERFGTSGRPPKTYPEGHGPGCERKFPALIPRLIVSLVLTGRDSAFNRFVLGLAATLPVNPAREYHEADRAMAHD